MQFQLVHSLKQKTKIIAQSTKSVVIQKQQLVLLATGTYYILRNMFIGKEGNILSFPMVLKKEIQFLFISNILYFVICYITHGNRRP